MTPSDGGFVAPASRRQLLSYCPRAKLPAGRRRYKTCAGTGDPNSNYIRREKSLHIP
jgi:hypothetical protein